MINKVIVSGRLTRDPEIRYLTTGTPVSKMTIAFNRRYKTKNSEQWQEETYFFDVEAMGTTADLTARLNKGFLVLVEGELRQDKWQDQNGQNKTKVKIHATKISILSKPQDANSKTETTQTETENLEDYEIPLADTTDEDVPF